MQMRLDEALIFCSKQNIFLGSGGRAEPASQVLAFTQQIFLDALKDGNIHRAPPANRTYVLDSTRLPGMAQVLLGVLNRDEKAARTTWAAGAMQNDESEIASHRTLARTNSNK
jgi:hypothetical protein